MKLTESQLRRAIRKALLTEQAAPPFKNMTKKQEDKFRNWVNDNHSTYAKDIDLDRYRSGSPNNSYVKEAWAKHGKQYLKDLGQSARAATPGIDVQSGSGPAKKSTKSQPNKTIGRSDLQKAIKSGKSLKKGSRGNAVKYIQTMLSTDVDGQFGTDTEKVVKSFQKSQKLQSHGAVDRETARKLLLLKEPVSVKDATNDKKEKPEVSNIILTKIKDAITGKGLPAHVRGFANFLLGRTDLWTENNFTSKEINMIKEIIKYSITPQGRKDSYNNQDDSKGALINYGVARGLNKSQGEEQSVYYSSDKARGYKSAILNVSDVDKIVKFLGAANPKGGKSEIKKIQSAVKSGKNITFDIVDRYNFNDKLKLAGGSDAFFADLKKSWGLLKDLNPYMAIRNLASWRQASGYNGFPISIKITL